LSEELKVAFPNTVPAGRSTVQAENLNSNWLSGFVSGDGGFHVNVFSSHTNNLGLQVKLIFKLTQHVKDEKLIRSLISYLGCGGYYRVNPEVGNLLFFLGVASFAGQLRQLRQLRWKNGVPLQFFRLKK
jgi:hypothetical protein